MLRIVSIVLLGILFQCLEPVWAQRGKQLLVSEDFSTNLNPNQWIAEIEPVGNSSVSIKNGKLVLDTGGGVTVWYARKLSGNLRIEYDWTVSVNSGPNDRLSDLNQFWMATDPVQSHLFTRNGTFIAYDSLSLYYVGFGGNTNTTTRFRKYLGNGQKPLLQEYLDTEHLLKPNHPYHIVIEVINGKTTFTVDGTRFFEYQDPQPLTSGYFGFRSTSARHAIDRFRVYRLW